MTTPAGSVAMPVLDKPRYLEWGPVLAGALAAAAISVLLLTFGAAVGLSVTSPWPNRGVSLTVAAWAVIWWSVAVEICAFSAGGYLAGRMRSRWGDSITDESQFRDGAHGFMVWALGVLVGAVLLAMTGGAVLKTGAQTAGVVAAGAASGASSNSAAMTTAPTDYAVDLLLRPAPRGASASATAPVAPAAAPVNAAQRGEGIQVPRGDDTALRMEAGRIFAVSIKNREFSASDRDYLTQVVMNQTGLPEAEAQKRVDAAMIKARDLEIKTREATDKARKAAVIGGFITAVSLLIGLVAACVAAGAGGKHRDEGRSPSFFGHHRFW